MMAYVTLEYLERSTTGEGWMLRFVASDASFDAIRLAIKALPRIQRYWNSRALGGRGAWWVSDEGLAQIASLFSNYQQMREQADRAQRSQHTREEEQRNSSYHSYSYRSYSGYSGSGSASSGTPTTREKAFATLYLLPTAPAEVAQAVYRVLAKQYHPDYGGDLEKMKQINAAYDVVKGSFTGGR